MPKFVDQCVESLLEENPDMKEEDAWAICQAQYKKLKEKGEIDEDIEFKRENLDIDSAYKEIWRDERLDR